MSDIKKLKEARQSMFMDAVKYFAKKFKVHLTKSKFKKIYGSSCYQPHQGEQEKARRRRQIERGIIRVN